MRRSRSTSSRLLVILALAAMAGGYSAASLADRPGSDADPSVQAAGVPSPSPSATHATPLPSPAPSPTPTPTQEPVLDHGAVASRVAAVVARPDLQLGGPVGIAVLDGAGREVFALDADRPLIPASTNKLVTAAGAVLEFGADHRFVTRAVGHATIRRDGTLEGDLTLVGAGDPSLVTDDYHRWIYPSRPWASLDGLADRLVARGLRRIEGGVVGDGTRFARPTTAPGWKGEYLDDLNARHVTGLTVDAGLDWWIEEPPPDVQLEIHLADDPTLEAATRLHDLLRDRGVRIGTRPRVATEPVDPDAIVIGAARSPTLASMLRHTLQRSDNHMADMLLVTVGAANGRGNWTGGAMALREHFLSHGLDLTGMLLDDGSGLSRRNRITARQLASLDALLAGSADGDAWRSMMATTGETGTLRGRLRGTIAAGRFFGKTGTLDDVRSLVGHTVGADGRRYHLAVVANDLTGGDRWQAYVLMDELVLTLVAELEGCALVAPSPAPSPSEPYRSGTDC